MTPKEKAEELVVKFSEHSFVLTTFTTMSSLESAKQCALIAVDEIIEEIENNYDTLHSSDRKFFWKEVKQEIEKL